MPLTRADFPEGFVLGAATAAYQIEGHAHGGAGPSHWDTFAATPGNVIRAEDGARACDHYHRWAEDLDLLRDMGADAYRFSTSWARVMPDGRTINPEGLDFYDRLVDGCVERGLRPFLTLYHWDLPAALSDVGGWTNRDIAQWFADYTAAVIDRIGDRVAATATLNEPWCVAWLSHFLGHHAPGHRDIRAAARAMHHVMLAHGTSMTRMREMGQDNLGIVLNFEHSAPATNNAPDQAAATRQDAIYNRWFIEAITQGTYPSEALEGLSPHMPANWQDDMAQISQPMDWLGVNYYTRSLIAHDADAAWPHLTSIEGPLPKTQMGWEIYPQGLETFLTRLARDYVGDMPIYVTENGMAWADTVDGNRCHDPERVSFIEQHLKAIAAAANGGANMRGFFYWSLLDNYEWAFGYEKRFGCVHVDFETLKRTPKDSYFTLQSLMRDT
ncbi:MAG: GH1 family beta-glucosidase [Pseudomonadota bacterium]